MRPDSETDIEVGELHDAGEQCLQVTESHVSYP